MGIERLDDVPNGVLGFRVGGTLTKPDYTDVLIPALQAAIQGGEGLRLVVVIEQDFERIEPGALWQDLKTAVGYELRHHSAWKRTAVVSDTDWIARTSQAFGWLAPGELCVFGRGELDAAVAWAAG
jgi:SpoIIAA-like